MNRKFVIIAFAGLTVGLLSTGCNSNPPEKKIENAKEDLRESESKAEEDKQKAEQERLEAENKYEEEWLKFKNEQEERLKQNETELTHYRENAAKMKKSDRADYDAKVANLEEKNRNLRTRMEEYDRETDKEKKRSGWENFKREFNHDMDELGHAFKDLGRDNTTAHNKSR